MKKIFKIYLITAMMITTHVFAASDGELKISKKDVPVKDCFETLNRATFSLNQGLDKVIFKPVAEGYRSLPSPVRTGTGNVLENLSNLITIPNNVLREDLLSIQQLEFWEYLMLLKI